MNRLSLHKQISRKVVLTLIYTRDFNDWHLSASLHLVMHALLTFLEANLHVQLTRFNGHITIMEWFEPHISCFHVTIHCNWYSIWIKLFVCMIFASNLHWNLNVIQKVKGFVAAAFNSFLSFHLSVHSFVIIAFFSFISLSRYRYSVRFFCIILLCFSPLLYTSF